MSALFSFFALLATVLIIVLVALFRRRRIKAALLLLVAATGSVYWLVHPVCKEIPEADLANFDPPIESREQANFYGLRTFQKRDGNWFQCKDWLSRQFFF